MEIADLVQGWADLWRKGNAVDVAEIFDANVRYEDKALGVVYHGLAELAAFRESYYAIYPDLTVDTTFFTDGASVCLAWTASGTQSADRPGLPSTGKRMTIEGLSWLTVKDGKFTSSRDYWDRETAWRQLR